MGRISKFVKSAEISVDAATKETYEKVRLGGKWEDIQTNPKFRISNYVICSSRFQL